MPGHQSSSHDSRDQDSTIHPSTNTKAVKFQPDKPVASQFDLRRATLRVLMIVLGIGLGLSIGVIMALNRANNAVGNVYSVILMNLPATQTQDPAVIADLEVLHRSLDKHLADWQAQKDNRVYYVPVGDTSLPADFNVKEVIHGYCASTQFYLFVESNTLPDGYDTAYVQGYEFTPGGSPYKCGPPGWRIVASKQTSTYWFFVTIKTQAAIQTVRPAAQ